MTRPIYKRAQDRASSQLERALHTSYPVQRWRQAQDVAFGGKGIVSPALVGASTLIPFFGPFAIAPAGAAAIGAARRGPDEGVLTGAARGMGYGLAGAVIGGGIGTLLGRAIATLITKNPALGMVLGGPIGMAIGTAMGTYASGRAPGDPMQSAPTRADILALREAMGRGRGGPPVQVVLGGDRGPVYGRRRPLREPTDADMAAAMALLGGDRGAEAVRQLAEEGKGFLPEE